MMQMIVSTFTSKKFWIFDYHSSYLLNFQLLLLQKGFRTSRRFRGAPFGFKSGNHILQMFDHLFVWHNLIEDKVSCTIYREKSWYYIPTRKTGNKRISFYFGILFLTMLTWAVFVTSLAQVAKCRVFRDCSTWLCAGLMVHIIAVLAFPPRESCRIRVSFESL